MIFVNNKFIMLFNNSVKFNVVVLFNDLCRPFNFDCQTCVNQQIN